MKKINKRFYFKFSIEDSWNKYGWKVFCFTCFYLKKYPPEGEELKFGRDYIGIHIVKHFNNLIRIV